MRYAKPGYAFYSVETPNVFLERELPVDIEQMTDSERGTWDTLLFTAETYGTSVEACNYQRG